MTRPTNKLNVTVKNVENRCREWIKETRKETINDFEWNIRALDVIGVLTCFLTPGKIITNAKNNVENRMLTATMDTSYVTDVRFEIV